MAQVNMQKWYKSNATQLKQLKQRWLEELEADKDFFGNWSEGKQAVYNHKLKFKPSQEISLQPVDDLLAEIERIDFILPDRPADLNAELIERWKEHVFDDYRLDDFEAGLKEVYSAFKSPTAYQFNGEDLEQAIQTAFYDYGYDRDKEDLITKIDILANTWAADGYPLAPGALSYDISQEANAFDRQRTTNTQDVFQNLARTVQQNIQWSIENGQRIEDLHMDFAIKYSELSKVFIQSAVDAYVAEIDKRIAEQKAQMMYISSLTKGMGLDVQADIKKHELELKERTQRLNGFTEATNTYLDSEAGSIIEELKLARNIAEGYGGLFASYGSLFTGISYEDN